MSTPNRPRPTYTLDDVRAFPAVVPAQVADRVLGIGVTTGKALRAAGNYPVRVLRHGRHHKVSTADLLAYLEGSAAGEPALPATAALRLASGARG